MDPTGTWSLYVAVDSGGDSGSIAGGWTLTITTVTPPVCCGGNSLADLNLVTGSSTTSTGIGSNITYTINVTNLGPNTASDVVVVDALPSIVNFVSATPSIGTFNNANGIVTFNLGTMTNGARASMSVVVTTTTSGYASNSVTVSSRAADPNPANNSSSLITAVSPPAPQVTSIRISASDVIITFTSTGGQFYRLEYADALPLAGWSTAVDSIAGTGGIVSVTHVGGAASTSRFYRLRLLP